MTFSLNIKICIIISIIVLNIGGLRLSKPKTFSRLNCLNCRKSHNQLYKNYKITYYWYDHRILYEINNFYFKFHQEALLYFKKLSTGKIRNLKTMPKNVVVLRNIDLKGPLVKIAEYKYPAILKSNPFSDYIWKRVWSGCDFFCFAANNFRLLKEGLVTEINEYRRIHGVNPLITYSVLEEGARAQARKNNLDVPIWVSKSPLVGYLGTICSLYKANFVIKKMYDKLLSNYQWNGKDPKNDISKFSQLIWKSTERIGVGVSVKGNRICIILFFNPKGGVGNFKKNVFPVTQRHIHMFNLFANKMYE
uniref:SCP domain-containing protein n=1 Tax=Strongyloides venezuelensis TaxID=75913 RepID=A0A0K0FJA8_STRVS